MPHELSLIKESIVYPALYNHVTHLWRNPIYSISTHLLKKHSWTYYGVKGAVAQGPLFLEMMPGAPF